LVIGAAVEGAFGERGWPLDLYWTFAFAATAVALLLTLPPLADRGVLGGGARSEIGRGNVAAALAAAGNRLAVGIVLSHCLYGADLQTFLVALAFVALAFASLVLMQWLYRLLTHYSDADEITDHNVAAALSYVGITLAFAIIVGNAADGAFTGWASSLARYAGAMLLGLGLYPVRQVVVHRLLLGLPFALRGGALDRAIDQERNAVIGAVEGAAYVATALVVTGIFP
jgi:uncharacterized membrane protein YjfL (UPF0719 family)